MTDTLEKTFKELLGALAGGDRLAATHTNPFFTFVHPPGETLEVHQRLRRWTATLTRVGFENVEVCSLRQLAWEIVDRSQRWEDWLEVEEPGAYEDPNRSMRDVLLREAPNAGSAARPGLMATLAPILLTEKPGRLLMLTDAGLLHPWVRADKIGTSLHDKIRCPTVLFYPGSRWGQYGLRFLGFYPEDPSAYRTTVLGGE